MSEELEQIVMQMTKKKESLEKTVEKSIQDNLEEFSSYAERLIDNGDSRTEVMDGSFILTDFDFDEDLLKGSMSFVFDSFTYHGCKDIDNTADHDSERSFDFIVDLRTNSIVFDEFELPPAWQPDLHMG